MTATTETYTGKIVNCYMFCDDDLSTVEQRRDYEKGVELYWFVPILVYCFTPNVRPCETNL